MDGQQKERAGWHPVRGGIVFFGKSTRLDSKTKKCKDRGGNRNTPCEAFMLWVCEVNVQEKNSEVAFSPRPPFFATKK